MVDSVQSMKWSMRVKVVDLVRLTKVEIDEKEKLSRVMHNQVNK